MTLEQKRKLYNRPLDAKYLTQVIKRLPPDCKPIGLPWEVPTRPRIGTPDTRGPSRLRHEGTPLLSPPDKDHPSMERQCAHN